MVNIKYTSVTMDDTLLFSNIVSFWSNSSLMMSRLLFSNGINYFHFLQPNQYYSKKKFTQEEQRIALNQDLAYSFLVKKGYPYLLKEVENLKKKDVNAFSAVEIFDKTSVTIYIDNCCHFNQLGNELFADFIADKIHKKINPQLNN